MKKILAICVILFSLKTHAQLKIAMELLKDSTLQVVFTIEPNDQTLIFEYLCVPGETIEEVALMKLRMEPLPPSKETREITIKLPNSEPGQYCVRTWLRENNMNMIHYESFCKTLP